MSQLKGTIYFRDNAWYKMENVIKMGISSVVKNRSNGYITGEVERGEYIYIIEIPLEKMRILDRYLKSYFKSYHIYKGGGTEFYNRCIIELIEPYLKQLNMEYRIFTKEEIHGLNRGERLINIPNVNKVKEIINQINVKNIIQKYKDKKIESPPPRFYCKDCYCGFNKIQHYNYHLESNKHKIRISKEKINLHICSHCQKSFSYLSNLSRHRSKCKENPVNDVSEEDPSIVDLSTEIKELRKRVEEIKKSNEDINKSNNNTTNQIQNINCFGKENLDHVTDKVIIECMDNVTNHIPLIIERIHFDPEHPENNNIKVPNKKLPHASVMSKKGSWKLVILNDAISSMINNAYNLLDKTFQEKEHLFSNNQKIHFKHFQSKYEDGDKKTIKEIKEAIKLLVISKTR